ncbi:Ankyrin repeat domain-containing protein 60 [Phytophthora pseudosyringae]|uniref:Ankyrin repeat domain-containing protein 60 n=1 Tax=Phytophthora pseudosyringae TaxID=221518 RepID=A0A8T1VU85_9STRA|nr:Ankyrin repeat domain-containing protein 60 [Phytophthora pseudosyringae]
MKSPSTYGSENEESNFIRRVAAPDRPNSKRWHKKRLALVGAVMILISATVAVGYATVQSGTIATPAKQQMAANLVVPDFVETMGDPYFPSFDDLDEDGDGIVTYGEYMKDLNEVWAEDKKNIAKSDLPDIVKDDLYDQLNGKITSDTACVKKAMISSKKRTLTFDRKTIDSLYYMLEVYCFDTPIEVPEKYLEMFPDTKAPVTMPAPVIPEVPAPPTVVDAEKKIAVDTPTGPATVTIDGPPVNGKEDVTITTPNGGTITTTVDVTKTSDGETELEIPTGTRGQTTSVTVPSQQTEGGTGSYQTNPTYRTEGGEGEVGTKMTVETNQGPATVVIDGPVINGEQEVTITKADGTSTTTTVDVLKTNDGETELDIPTGPEGQTTPVALPESTNPTTRGPFEKPRVVDVDTSEGMMKVLFFGPIIDGKQSATVLKFYGKNMPEKTVLDVTQLADGRNTVEIPIGPGGETTRVTIPPFEGPMPMNPQTSIQAPPPPPEVVVDTPQGRTTVLIDGPVIDGKQDVTIETPDGGVKTTTVDVVPTADGKNELEIPGHDGKITTVTEPTNPSQGSGDLEDNGGSKQVQQTVEVDTPHGPATVTIDGPVIDGKQEVTITTPDGGTTTTTVEVTPTSDGKNAMEVSTGPEGQTTIVTVPQPPKSVGSSSGSQTRTQATPPEVVVDTAQGSATVTIDGPVSNGEQEVTITKADGTTTTTTVDVTKTSDGKTEMELPTGPRGQTTSVTVPSQQTEGGAASYSTVPQTNIQSPQPRMVDVDTTHGRWTVIFNGPILPDYTQSFTVLKHDGSDPEARRDEVGQRDDGSWFVHLWTGDEHKKVTIPGDNAVATTVSVMTPQGPATVETSGPVIGGKQDVKITMSDGKTTTTTVDVTKTSDGKTELELPMGPGGTTTTVTVPSTSTEGGGVATTTDVLNQLGGNDIDNGDKDFMSKDEFQLQIGTHYSEKIMALKEQTTDEEEEANKLLNQQKQLQDCILQAADKFGYYGVYEQPPYFQSAVTWVDNDCLKQ